MMLPERVGATTMQDLRAKLEKLLSEADDCELISALAGDFKKREFFAKLAIDLRRMARDTEAIIISPASEVE
jgi:hypothetical protein